MEMHRMVGIDEDGYPMCAESNPRLGLSWDMTNADSEITCEMCLREMQKEKDQS